MKRTQQWNRRKYNTFASQNVTVQGTGNPKDVHPVQCKECFSVEASYSRVKCYESLHSTMSTEWDSFSIRVATSDELIPSLQSANS